MMYRLANLQRKTEPPIFPRLNSHGHVTSTLGIPDA